jgi:hypothetical protein
MANIRRDLEIVGRQQSAEGEITDRGGGDVSEVSFSCVVADRVGLTRPAILPIARSS